MAPPCGEVLSKPISLLVSPFTVSQIDQAHRSLKTAVSDPKCHVKSISDVQAGDHIVLRPKMSNMVDKMLQGQHGIVMAVNKHTDSFIIIHYKSEIFEKRTNARRLHIQSLVKGRIAKSRVTLNKDFDVFKVNHKDSFKPWVILQRAHARLGETDFNFFFNNDEHFAYFCATGTPRSCRNKMYVLRLARFTVKLYSMGRSIYLVMGLKSHLTTTATYFYNGAARLKPYIQKDIVIKAKDKVSGVLHGFMNNWLLVNSCSGEFTIADGLDVPLLSSLKQRKTSHKNAIFTIDKQNKAVELGSNLVARTIGQTVARTAVKSGSHQLARGATKEAFKKGAQVAARAGHHVGKHAIHHAAKGAAVKSALTSASKSSGHGVAGAVKAAARGQGLAIGMGALISVGFATKDIMNAKKQIKEGEISSDQYNNVVTRKVAGATTDIALGTYGAVMGTMLAGPVGAVLGGFMGSMVGSVVGEEIGEELDKNNMGLKWAKEKNDEECKSSDASSKLEPIAESKERKQVTDGYYPMIASPSTESKSNSNIIEDPASTRDIDSVPKEADKLTSETLSDNDANNSSPQGLDALLVEYIDSMFHRKKKEARDSETHKQNRLQLDFPTGLWGMFFGDEESEEPKKDIDDEDTKSNKENQKNTNKIEANLGHFTNEQVADPDENHKCDKVDPLNEVLNINSCQTPITEGNNSKVVEAEESTTTTIRENEPPGQEHMARSSLSVSGLFGGWGLGKMVTGILQEIVFDEEQNIDEEENKDLPTEDSKPLSSQKQIILHNTTKEEKSVVNPLVVPEITGQAICVESRIYEPDKRTNEELRVDGSYPSDDDTASNEDDQEPVTSDESEHEDNNDENEDGCKYLDGDTGDGISHNNEIETETYDYTSNESENKYDTEQIKIDCTDLDQTDEDKTLQN